MQMKYRHKIFVKYWKIFHRNFTILIFWNIYENKYIFNIFRNIVERFRWNKPILHILIIFQNVASNNEPLFFLYYISKIPF